MIFRAALVGAAVFLAAPRPAAAETDSAETSSTAEFLDACKSDHDGCASILADMVMFGDFTCIPHVDEMIAALSRHPDWSKNPWDQSAEAAAKEICGNAGTR